MPYYERLNTRQTKICKNEGSREYISLQKSKQKSYFWILCCFFDLQITIVKDTKAATIKAKHADLFTNICK